MKEYAAKYYLRTEVTKENNWENLYRMIVPEADTSFLLGLSKFNVTVTKIRPSKDNRIIISMVLNK